MSRILHFGRALTCAGGLAALGCANPADNAPEAFVGEPLPVPGEEVPVARGAAPVEAASGISPTGPAAQVYEFSGVGSTVKFLASKVTRSHHGGFSDFRGEIQLVDGTPEGSRVHVVIQTKSLGADNPVLMTHLASPDFFDIIKYPTATFTSTTIAPRGADYLVTGNLEFHGVTKSLTFPATIEVGEAGVTADAEFFIHRSDFGITYPGMADDLIREEVVLRLNISATPVQAPAA